MSYLIGCIGAPFIISFLIINFIVKKKYLKKNGQEMSTAKAAGWTIGLGIILLLLTILGGNH